MPGKPRATPKKPRRLFLKEHREATGLTQKQLAARLDVADMSVSRWETGDAKLNTDVLAALAEVLDREVEDLWRPPSRPSLDAITRHLDDANFEDVLEVVRRATRICERRRR